MPATATIPEGWELVPESEAFVPEGWEAVPEFDPEGSGYDYDTAIQEGLSADETGHWPSRAPSSGALLKGRKHKTWGLLEEGEREAGYEISQGENGRYYSQPQEPEQPPQPDAMQANETTLAYKRRRAVARGADPDLEQPTASASARDEAVKKRQPGYSDWKAVVTANSDTATISEGIKGDRSDPYYDVPIGARFMDADGNWYKKTGWKLGDRKKLSRDELVLESKQDLAKATEVLVDMMDRGGNRGEMLKVLERLRPDQYQMLIRVAAEIIPETSEGLSRGSFPARLLEGLGTGFWEAGESAAELVGLGGNAEQLHAIHSIRNIHEGEMPLVQPDESIFTKWPVQAAQMFGPMYAMIRGGRLGKVAAGTVGVKALPTGVRLLPRAAQVAGRLGATAGVTATGFPRAYRSNLNEMLDAGVDMDTAKQYAVGAGGVHAAIESILPDPFKRLVPPGVKLSMTRVFTQFMVRYGIENIEEGLQGASDESFKVFATWADQNAPDLDMSQVGPKFAEAIKESYGPLLILMGPSSAAQVGGVHLNLRQRKDVERIQALMDAPLEESTISREDAKSLKRLGLIDVTGLKDQGKRTEAVKQSGLLEAIEIDKEAQDAGPILDPEEEARETVEEQVETQPPGEVAPAETGKEAKERISGPVLVRESDGKVFRGRTHADIFANYKDQLTEADLDASDLFETSTGRILGSAEAAKIAHAAGQTDKPRKLLVSEAMMSSEEVAALAEEEGAVEDAAAKPEAKKKAEPEATDTTSTKHAKTEELRARAGLPDRVPATPEKIEEWEAQARRDYPDAEARLKVVGIAEQHPERIGKVQDAAIGQHLVDLNNRLDSGEDVQDELLRTVKASEVAGTEIGRALRGRQTERYSDFSLAGLIRQHLDTVGTDPSPEEMTRYKEMADKIEQLEGTVKEAEKKAVQDEIDKRIAGISAKRRETIESRFEKQYETAADFGIDPKALREAAEERAEAEAATAREYNAAYKAVVKATGLTPAVIRDRETSEDLAEYKGLDTTAPALAREFPELGLQPESEGAEQTKDHVQALVELIKQGPRFVPQWHDKLAEVAREMSSESGKPVADDFQFPWEGVSGEGAFAPDSPAGAKKPTRAKKGSKRVALQRKASEAVAAFKNAWVDVGKAATSAGTGPTVGGLNPEVIKATARAAKAAAGVVRAYAELGVNSFVEFMANVRRDIGTISDDQVKVFRDAWDEVKSEGAIESPLGEDPEKSEIGARARQLMEAAVESGIGTLTINKDGTTTFEGTEEVVDAVHEVLSEEVPGITRDDTMQAVSQYGEFQPLNMADTKVKVRAIRGQVRQALKLQDLRNAIALSKQWLAEGVEPGVVASRLRDRKLLPKATGRQQATPDSIERALIAEVNEAKKGLPVPAESTPGQLASALTTAKRAANNRLADEAAAIKDLEKSIKNKTPLAKPGERAPSPTDPELNALHEELTKRRAARRELKVEYDKIFPPKKSVFSDAQQLKMAENLLSRQVAELEADEAAGRLEPEAKPAKAPVTSAKLDVTKKRKAELLAAREEARKASPAFQAKLQSKREASYLKSQQRRLAFWEARLADAKQGKLPAKRKATPESAEIIDRKLEIEKVQYQAMAEIEKVKRANWNAGQWIGHGLLEATSYIPKNLMLGLEWSFFKRQGFFYGRAHPIRAFANAVQAIQASFSARIAFAAMEDIENRPDAKEYHQGGVEFTHVSGPKHVLEEVFQSSVLRWLENTEGLIWLPLRTWAKGYMIAERGNRSFANTMKADTYDITKRDTMAAREFFGDSKPWSAEDIKEAGRISNIFSGRGTGLRGGNPWLDFVFLARRWAWSRIQTDFVVPFQLMTPKKIGQWNADRGMRVAVAKLYLQTLLGHATKMAIGYWIYMLAAGDDDEKKPTIEWDLRSTDAWKLKVGETTIDDMGGTVQPLVLAARVGTGELKTRKGEIKSIYGEDVQYGGQTAADFIVNYGLYKLGTGPSAILEWAGGEDAVGQPVTKTDIVVSRITPLTWREVADAERELGVEQGTLAALEAIFGATVSTYGPRTKYRKADKEKRKELFEKDLKQLQWDSPPPAYSEFLTAEQTKQVEDRIEEKRQGVIYDATDKKPIQAKHGSKEAYEKALKTWETQQERFEGLSKEEEASSYAKAHEMLLLHFADVAGKRDEQAAVDKALKRGEAPPSITGKKPRLKKNGEPWGHVVKNSGGNWTSSYKDRRAALKKLYGVK